MGSRAQREHLAVLESPRKKGIDWEAPREKHMRLFHCEVNVSDLSKKDDLCFHVLDLKANFCGGVTYIYVGTLPRHTLCNQ